MKKAMDEFTLAFISRTREARTAANLTQDEVARVLGIEQPTYKWYETRTPLPHRYVAPFCTLTRVSSDWLFTGRRPPRNGPSSKSSDAA